jgi:hypothetical protein
MDIGDHPDGHIHYFDRLFSGSPLKISLPGYR